MALQFGGLSLERSEKKSPEEELGISEDMRFSEEIQKTIGWNLKTERAIKMVEAFERAIKDGKDGAEAENQGKITCEMSQMDLDGSEMAPCSNLLKKKKRRKGKKANKGPNHDKEGTKCIDKMFDEVMNHDLKEKVNALYKNSSGHEGVTGIASFFAVVGNNLHEVALQMLRDRGITPEQYAKARSNLEY